MNEIATAAVDTLWAQMQGQKMVYVQRYTLHTAGSKAAKHGQLGLTLVVTHHSRNVIASMPLNDCPHCLKVVHLH